MGSRLLPDKLSDCLELLEHRHPSSIDLGLERCGEVWLSMGSPRPARRVFSVAGTNGKGSTVATLCALLGALGQRYGCYTSPHLVNYNERIRVNGLVVSDEDLLQAFEIVEKARGKVSLSYFEFGTLAAFEILSRANLDVAVMEVGLGGRLDAVNLIDADCAVITPIGLDHQAWLGDDRVSIGREKAGIIRPGCPVISGEHNPPSSVVSRAHDLGSPLKCLGRDFVIERVEDRARLAVDGRVLDLPLPVLAGAHQLDNLATSLAALLELFPAAAGTPELLERGIRAVSLSGRFERISQQPAIWIDVGHNPMAATAMAAALAGVGESENIAKCRCVIGMLVDKDAERVAEELRHVVDSWYCAGLKGERGQTGAALASRLQKAAGTQTVNVFETVSQAFDAAIEDSGPNDGILVFGSFLTATEALLHWRSQNHDT
jgi:dihydrofolate synthase/folylpolyglutamate synthase